MTIELQRFLQEVVTKAGGTAAVAQGLYERGFAGQDGPLETRTIRTWLAGTRMPGADVLFALANKYGVSMDRYAGGSALAEEFERMRQRIEALGAAS